MKKRLVLYILMIAFVICAGRQTLHAADDDKTPVKKVDRISVDYKGDSILVGEEYDIEDLEVTVYYDDDTSEIVTDYNAGNRKVNKGGENTFTIVYKGKRDTFTVIGKSVESIYATYNGGEHSVGNKINEQEVAVTVTYSDSSTEELEEGYVLSNTVIRSSGENTVTVTYKTKKATFVVYGYAAKALDSVYVAYIGGPRVLGAKIRPQDVDFTAYYKDGTSESIYNFTLSPSTITQIGPNTITASFKGKSDKFVVEGTEKIITGITAKYTGGSVAVGRKVRLQDIVVTATYNDGTTDVETEFDIMGGGKILSIGTNTLTIDAQGNRATITVTGIEASASDFASLPSYDIAGAKSTIKVALDVPSEYKKEDVSVSSVEVGLVRNVLSEEIRMGEYIPFEIKLVDLDLDLEIPMMAQITVPSNFNVNGCSVFFTPNRKSVLAQMNTEIVGTNSLQFHFFHEGTYVLTYDPDWKDKKDD